jgi:hypothetical protein
MMACARLAMDGSVSDSSDAWARSADQIGSQKAIRSAGSDMKRSLRA